MAVCKGLQVSVVCENDEGMQCIPELYGSVV